MDGMVDTILDAVDDVLNREAERLLRPFVPETYTISCEIEDRDSLYFRVEYCKDGISQYVLLVADIDHNYHINVIRVEYFNHNQCIDQKYQHCHIHLDEIAPRLTQALRWLEIGDAKQASAYLAGLTDEER